MSDLFFEKQSSEEYESSNSPEPQNSKPANFSQPPRSLASKPVHKNKYINKIKDILPETQLRSMRQIKVEEGSVMSLDKKERNKYSAKQSRDRKKLYIEILEQKQKVLAKTLQNRKKELQQTKNYLQRVVNQNKTMSGFTASRHQMIKKLEQLLDRASKGQNPSAQINQIIDSLRYRIGATGKERINTINEYFRQIVNLSLPALHRYMMWSAAEGKHLFNANQNEEEQDQWYVELKNTLNLSEQQRKEIQSKQEFLKQQKILLEKLINDLKTIKNQIEEKSIELEAMIDGIRQILSPIQCAHFILFIQKNKYRKELNLCESTIDDQDPGSRKMVKRQ